MMAQFSRILTLTLSTACQFFGQQAPPESSPPPAAASSRQPSLDRSGQAGLPLPHTKAVPDFVLQDLDGKGVAWSSFKGKPVLVSFWATWCGPCRAEMPQVEEAQRLFGEGGLVVLAINLGETPEVARKYITENRYAFHVLLDRDGALARKFSVALIPTLLLIDRDGDLSARFGGFNSARDLKEELKKIGVQAPPESSPPAEAAASQQPPLYRNDQDLSFAGSQQDALIREAANAALDFTETLPNYVCQEMVTRYNLSGPQVAPVAAEVVYENGKENYRNITVGGRPFRKTMEDIGGVLSTGEFGTTLVNLFSLGTAAQFQYLQDSSTGGVNAKRYGLEVAQENSRWVVKFGSKRYVPAYIGNVWIDPATSRVLRIEMVARNFPGDFGADYVELGTDYEYVKLGGTEQYLLPAHSETVVCRRAICARNVVDFRNYKKFEGQSTITFGDAR